MHKLLSRIFAVVAFVAVVPVVAFASSSRVEGLGVPGDYVKDYSGINTYLSGVGSVGNLVWVNPGSDNSRGMGAVLQNLFEGRFGTWAINLHDAGNDLGAATYDGNPFDSNTSTGEALDITWGRKMGNGSLGLRFNRSYNSTENTGGTTTGNGNGDRNITGFGGGYGFALNSNTDAEVSVLYQNRSFNNGTVKESGGSAYQVAGRAWVKSSSSLTLAPVVKIYSFDNSTVPVAAGGIVVKNKTTGWSAGLAGNWALGSDDLFILGTQFSSNKNETTVDAKSSFMPDVFMGLESKVNPWLTLRFGAHNSFQHRTENATTTVKDHQFSFNMGAGVKVGAFMFDATMSNGFYNGPVNGVLNGNPFNRVSATYSF